MQSCFTLVQKSEGIARNLLILNSLDFALKTVIVKVGKGAGPSRLR